MLCSLLPRGLGRRINMQYPSWPKILGGCLSASLALTDFSRGDKLGRESPKGGHHAKGTTNVYERVQGRSRALGEEQRQEYQPGSARSGYWGQYAASLVPTLGGAGGAGVSWQRASDATRGRAPSAEA